MQVDYTPFVDRMIHQYEGNYGWDRGDPGGPTKYGITCYDLAEHRGQKMTSMAAWAPIVQAMSLQEAEDIYRTKYASAIGFDALPAGPDCCEMDYGVNSGLGRVKLVRGRLLQKASKGSVQECDPKWYVDAMCQERLAFLESLRTWPEFKGGWSARVADLKLYCEHLTAAGDPTKGPPVSGVTPVPKATHTDPNLTKHITVAVTSHGTGVATAVHQGLHIPAAIAIGMIGALGLVGYAVWRAHQNEALNQTVVLPATIPPHP